MPDISCPIPRILTRAEARAIFSQVKRDLGKGLGDPAYLREAARRAGQDYTTFRRSWLGKAESAAKAGRVEATVARDALSFSGEADASAYITRTQSYLGERSGYYASRISDEQIGMVADYTGMGGFGVNDALREGATLSAEDRAKVAAMDHIMGLTEWPKDFTTYRGAMDTDGTFTRLQVGDVFRDAGYTSTSLNPQVAEFYGELAYGANGVPVTMEIIVPKGSKAIATEPLMERIGIDAADAIPEDAEAPFSKLNEVILPRGSSFRVLSREMDNGHLTIRMVVQ